MNHLPLLIVVATVLGIASLFLAGAAVAEEDRPGPAAPPSGPTAGELAALWKHALALYEAGELEEAAREFEHIVRLDEHDVHALDKLRMIYATLEDWESLLTTLERMLPLVDDPEVSARMHEMIARLKAKDAEHAESDRERVVRSEDEWAALLEQCTNAPSVEVRRKALQTYYEADAPRVSHTLLGRCHPNTEPDAICRGWLVRIMGQLNNPRLAQVLAFALRDPDLRVRSAAAEALGNIRTTSGLIYLMYTLVGMPLDASPTEAQVDLLNAARRSVIHITERPDALGTSDVRVPAESLAAMRKDWITWLTSTDGVHARIAAIADLEAQGDLRPDLYLLDDVSDPEPEIARAAYGVLLRRSKLPSEDEVADRMWPKFPVFGDEAFEEANLGVVRGAVTDWWKEWKAERKRSQRPRQDDKDAEDDGE